MLLCVHLSFLQTRAICAPGFEESLALGGTVLIVALCIALFIFLRTDGCITGKSAEMSETNTKGYEKTYNHRRNIAMQKSQPFSYL
jgi:hypothetical protein